MLTYNRQAKDSYDKALSILSQMSFHHLLYQLGECSTLSRNRPLRVYRKSREPLNSIFVVTHTWITHTLSKIMWFTFETSFHKL